MKNRIVLLGPPASGKGTQASLLGAVFGIPHVSTGAIVREERAKGTPIGLEADSYASRGLLFPDELALRFVGRWLGSHSRFIFDGFPRTIGQAISLDSLLESKSSGLQTVYLLELPDDEVRARMLGRLTCRGCGAVFNEKFHKLSVDAPCPKCDGVLARRQDDTLEALDHRLSQYHEFTKPISSHYEAAGLLKKVDVRFGRDAVFQLLYNDLRADS
ncbi:MAG: nucleoside monophosphate kinase [Terrimicrobiaceae bacterium]